MGKAGRRIAHHIEQLGNADYAVAGRAGRHLVRHYAERAAAALVAATVDINAERRWRAGWVLAACRRPEALEVLLRLLEDPVDFVRYEATCALGLLGEPALVSPLTDMYRAGARWQDDGTPVYLALKDIGEAAAWPMLALSRDPDENVRGLVAHYAGNACHATWASAYRPAFEDVCLGLARDPSPAVRTSAVEALGWMGTPAAREAVLKADADADQDVRAAADYWLGEWGRADARGRRLGRRPPRRSGQDATRSHCM